MRRRLRWLVSVMVVAVSGMLSAQQGTPAFVLNPREHVVILGNTLAERFQYDGWLETLIQARYPKHELVFRNLGFSGDEVATRLRSMNFGTPDEWLSANPAPIGGYQENRFEGINTKPDVIFAFFGYNESYGGKEGVPRFVDELSAWVDHTRAQKYNGRSAPRLVLFSPIAHEDLRNPDLPDGRANNERLAIYTAAMRDLALRSIARCSARLLRWRPLHSSGFDRRWWRRITTGSIATASRTGTPRTASGRF
jgi:hypothetical protein